MHDPDAPDGQDRQLGRLFGRLRGSGPEAEDSARMWRRLEAALPPRRSPATGIRGWLPGAGPARPAWRFAAVAAAAVALGMIGAGIVLWSAPPSGVPVADAGPGSTATPGDVTGIAPERRAGDLADADGPRPTGGDDLVLLSPPALVAAAGATEGAADAAASPGDEPETSSRAAPDTPATPSADEALAAVPGWELDVRLVRGYEGDLPADALVGEALGAGGASRLQELRATLRALLPFDDYALLGQWTGAVVPDEQELSTDLAAGYRLDFRARPDLQGNRLRLEGVRLQGAGEPRSAGAMTLLPGQLYLLGVRGNADDASLVLAVRARRATGPGAGDPPRN